MMNEYELEDEKWTDSNSFIFDQMKDIDIGSIKVQLSSVSCFMTVIGFVFLLHYHQTRTFLLTLTNESFFFIVAK